MLTKYQPNFASLTPDEAAHAAASLCRATDLVIDTESGISGNQLFSICGAENIGQAQVVMSMARDPSHIGVVCLEKLVGTTLRRPEPEKKARAPRAAPKGNAVRRSDPRVIAHVEPNPKKSGSKSHARYEHYQVGMTVDQFVAAGGSMDDVRHDVGKGFVRLEEK
jgi:hypothetical protein